MSRAGFITCPNCSATCASDANYCGKCGTFLDRSGPYHPTNPFEGLPQSPKTLKLHNSYSRLPDTQAVISSPSFPQRQGNKRRTIVFTVLALLIIGAALFTGVLIGRVDIPETTKTTRSTPFPNTSANPGTAPTNGSSTTIVAVPTQAPTPTPSPTPSPTPVPTWQGCQYGPNGWANWSFPSGWTVLNGMVLTNDNRDNATIAPDSCQPTVLNYQVEMKIKILNNPPWAFGVFVRYTPGVGGYGTWLSIRDCTVNISYANDVNNLDQEVIKGTGVNFCSGEHTYRTVVRNNIITFFVDGTQYLMATDNTYVSSPGQVGLFVHLQSEIESFSVTPVSGG